MTTHDNGVAANGGGESRLDELKKKYAEESDKRLNLRPEGDSQYINLQFSDLSNHYLADPWVPKNGEDIRDPPLNEGKCKYLVVGAGFAGLEMAVRLIQNGVDVSDIRMVDKAAGYGGTWYWNRFPGIACDIESYIYIPLLEEIGWQPKHKYSYGGEIRQACEAIADKFQLRDKTFFRRGVTSMKWDDNTKEWIVGTEPEGTQPNLKPLDIKADFVLLGPGLANHPKLSKLPGIESFKGHSIHSARWDYEYTGGSPDDPHPAMENLKGKTVGIIGTGCSAVQILPEVSKWAKHVYVFQRTPSSVTQRQNPPTDPEDFKSVIAPKPGWQAERMDNFASIVHKVDPPPEKDLVDDECTHWMNHYALGGWHKGVTMEEAPAFLETLHRQDAPHTDAIRNTIDEIVKDRATADKLKFWFPSWCKRPAFHSDWYQAFNKPNVTLVDTNAKGVERITEKGVVANGEEYPVDLLVYSTGYKIILGFSPPLRGLMKITGRDGVDFEEMWSSKCATLHGICSHGFPNLFWPGPTQGGFTSNQTYTIDLMARQIAYVITTAEKKTSKGKVLIEPGAEACEEWTMRVIGTAAGMMHAGMCGPNYFNNEGDLQRMLQKGPEEQMKVLRTGIWASGAVSYSNVLQKWRDDGDLKGLNVEIVA